MGIYSPYGIIKKLFEGKEGVKGKGKLRKTIFEDVIEIVRRLCYREMTRTVKKRGGWLKAAF